MNLPLLLMVSVATKLWGQVIPLDTLHWEITAKAYVLETFQGEKSIYLQEGLMSPKNIEFENGTIEYDIYLKKEQAFPGVFFRINESTGDAEQFYVRPHQSGNPDANQAAPMTKYISPWQLYFGPKYSFPYDYFFDDWTHIKIVVRDDKAQVFMNYSEVPNLSWNLFTDTKKGAVSFSGGYSSGFHLANIKINNEDPDLIHFKPTERAPIEGLISHWKISDMFEEEILEEPSKLTKLIDERTWQGIIEVEEGTAANISRIQNLRDGSPGNTVLAKITIESEKDQLKLFEFGYSDRVVAILNGKPIYLGTNRWRSRDYRYLGTIGLFDAIYLDLKKGENELLMAVSEDFGGWLITGRFKDKTGIKVKK